MSQNPTLIRPLIKAGYGPYSKSDTVPSKPRRRCIVCSIPVNYVCAYVESGYVCKYCYTDAGFFHLYGPRAEFRIPVEYAEAILDHGSPYVTYPSWASFQILRGVRWGQAKLSYYRGTIYLNTPTTTMSFPRESRAYLKKRILIACSHLGQGYAP